MAIILDIRSRRDALGWSQSELARRSGVPQPMISRLERLPQHGGQKGVSFEVLGRLAKTLRVHPRHLISIVAASRVKPAPRRKRRRRRS